MCLHNTTKKQYSMITWWWYYSWLSYGIESWGRINPIYFNYEGKCRIYFIKIFHQFANVSKYKTLILH